MSSHTVSCCSVVPVLAALALALPAVGGPLTPPPGAVMPTFKTLKEVEPRQAITFENNPGDVDSVHVLNQEGSYYLMSNVYVPGGRNGIKITSANVTLDLNGFAIIDLGGAAGPALAGVVSAPGATFLVVKNGSVSGGVRGLFLAGSDSSRIEDVTCEGQVSESFFLGASSVVSDCIARGASHGFFVGDGTQLSNCSALACGVNGFWLAQRSAAFDCTARSSATGFLTAPGCVLDGCSAFAGNKGFELGDRCVARDCSSDGAAEVGFDAGAKVSIDRCSAALSPSCFTIGARTRLTNSTASTAGGEADIAITCRGDEALVKGNTILDSVGGVNLLATADQCTVVGNYISSSITSILNAGSQNHIGLITFDPATAGPHDNLID